VAAAGGVVKREAPTYEQIADALETVFDAAEITILADQDGHPITLLQIARCLDKAGLIDRRGVA
jgi:hypothetical protein